MEVLYNSMDHCSQWLIDSVKNHHCIITESSNLEVEKFRAGDTSLRISSLASWLNPGSPTVEGRLPSDLYMCGHLHIQQRWRGLCFTTTNLGNNPVLVSICAESKKIFNNYLKTLSVSPFQHKFSCYPSTKITF